MKPIARDEVAVEDAMLGTDRKQISNDFGMPMSAWTCIALTDRGRAVTVAVPAGWRWTEHPLPLRTNEYFCHGHSLGTAHRLGYSVAGNHVLKVLADEYHQVPATMVRSHDVVIFFDLQRLPTIDYWNNESDKLVRATGACSSSSSSSTSSSSTHPPLMPFPSALLSPSAPVTFLPPHVPISTSGPSTSSSSSSPSMPPVPSASPSITPPPIEDLTPFTAFTGDRDAPPCHSALILHCHLKQDRRRKMTLLDMDRTTVTTKNGGAALVQTMTMTEVMEEYVSQKVAFFRRNGTDLACSVPPEPRTGGGGTSSGGGGTGSGGGDGCCVVM